MVYFCFNMKNLFAFCLILFSCPSLLGQTFEGRVTYSCSYSSKLPGVSDEQFTSMMGDTQQYFIKGGNYRIEANGLVLSWQVYRNKENRLYTKMAVSESILFNEGTENFDELTGIQINRNAATVLGLNCHEVVITSKSGVQKYYFSEKYKMNPSDFTGFAFANWGEYVKAAKAVPLKMVIRTSRIDADITATEISGSEIPDSTFALPEGVAVIPNPYK